MISGRLVQLRRYPVKSLLGERIPTAEIGVTGVAGDRALALLDRASGRVASAKQPHRWRDLLALRATGGAPDPVRITLPDGRHLSVVDPDIDVALSAAVGHPVTLVDAVPAGATLLRSHPEAVLAVPTLAHGPLPPETEALRVPARLNRVEPLPGMGAQPCVGAYATVVRAGRVADGDRVTVG
ncbi:MOSC N-terminal beta barrel domain-containing protein [Micromonospora sp. STR1_7]|uniref:MOSC N-terminal beta barrel domain-containing protein n=1 Tax=Micromonospora parastrephiae TaxID=2806101 RepID=A0ABS1Y193_9ACTN|nr:MOSC N-terminal beta barrel domain-containing protein [Micromonospora parastrephiae]MBM0235281.1 MOSC N-terminal beta barrel domain-containing protein [Micromonospora parastrephiae]